MVLADLHYVTVNRKHKHKVAHPLFICRHREKKGVELQADQKRFNTAHATYRSKVETTIANISNRFGWLNKPWLKDRQSLFEIVVIATAINNCVVNGGLNFN